MHKNTRLAIHLTAIVLGMGMLAYASVPLYRLFCESTGFGGTAKATTVTLPATPSTQNITVRFDANVSPALPWQFKAPKPMTLKIGEKKKVLYVAKNIGSIPTIGTATFNVTPTSAGKYFNKIQCFCFNRLPLKPGQKDTLGVTFFIDPAINNDPEARLLSTITLSYTFFPVEKADK